MCPDSRLIAPKWELVPFRFELGYSFLLNWEWMVLSCSARGSHDYPYPHERSDNGYDENV